ncbi:MAG: hypothetical protein V2B20_07090 [Pseudomonadota bacterium]
MRIMIFNRSRIANNALLFLVIVLLQIIFSLFQSGHLSAAIQAGDQEPVELSLQKVEEILAGRSFISGDELFQLLYLLYREDRNTSFRLNRETLRFLNEKVTTLFPLDGCQAIEVRNLQVVFIFAKEQQVAIPHTLHQASLKISRKLVLAIAEYRPVSNHEAGDPFELDTASKSVQFLVKEGSLQLHFSFLLKLFGGSLRDAEGSALIYQINEQKKMSRMQLIEETPLSGGRLRIVQPGPDGKIRDMQWIDILHPDFPGQEDIGISPSRITFLGTDVELLPDDMIRIGKDEPRKNEKAWNWFTDNIKSFRDYLQTGEVATQINYTRNFGYHFEERQIVMTMGFHGAEEKIPELMSAGAAAQ